MSIAIVIASYPFVNAAGTTHATDMPVSPTAFTVSKNKRLITDTTTIIDIPVTNADSNDHILNDPHLDKQWYFSEMFIEMIHRAIMKRPVVIGILDTGIDKNHEDLAGAIIDEVNYSDTQTLTDINGHGTAIAGMIGAKSDNSIGIAGIASNVHLLNVKVADDKGKADPSSVASGIRWAAERGADVINISLVFKESSKCLEEAINYAWDRGAVIVAPVSNIDSQSPVYPANYPRTIAVVALRQNDTVGPMYGYGPLVDVAAPGYHIYTTIPSNGYSYKTGTSFAAAYVSGLAAIMIPIAEDWNRDGHLRDEVINAIKQGCILDTEGVARIDAAKSLRWILTNNK
jgi:thermitase